jgi:small-conductance mechanosensitive channel
MADDRSQPSIGALFSEVFDQTTHLVRTEIRLARAEISEKLVSTARASGIAAAGGAILLGALYLFLLFFVRLLVAFGIAEHWATLIVAVASAAIGYAVLRTGLAHMSTDRLMPTRTTHSLEKDAAMAKEVAR